MNHSPPYTARPLLENGILTDILVARDGREIPMLGSAGKNRELAILSDNTPESLQENRRTPCLPVLVGSGTGAALEEMLSRREKAGGTTPVLAVVDKEEAILAASGLRERFSRSENIVWINEDSAEAAIHRLSRLQDEHKGAALCPVLNPFYLRLDRDYYHAVFKACKSSRQANFWDKARYPKFQGEQSRILLITSQYFLIGEIVGACERLGVPHRLLRMPEGELGRTDFVEKLLAAVLDFKPDFIFTINHLGVDREGVLTELLARLRLPLVSWFVDNPHLILYLYSSLVSPWTSIFTWDADNLQSLRDMGFSHVRYLPLGVDATRFKPAEPGQTLPGLPGGWNRQISFVGNSMVHKVRKRLERSAIPASLTESYPALARDFGKSNDRSVRYFLRQSHPECLAAFESMPGNEDRLNYETLLTWEATRQYRLSCLQGIMPLRPLIVGDSGWQDMLPPLNNKGWHYHREMSYYDSLYC